MLVTEPHANLLEIVTQAIAGGVNVVQLRAKDNNAIFDLFDAAWALNTDMRGDVLLLINYWYWLVRKTDADGAHLPENCMFTLGGVRANQPEYLLGQSVHSVDQAIVSASGGADYLIAGTIFASQSHPDVAPQGLGFLHDVCASVALPTLAIGGITPARVAECIEAGAAGVAVLSPLMRAADPEAVAGEYWRALQEAWKAKQCA